MMLGLRVVFLTLELVSCSWVRILNSPTVLQSDIEIGYKIDHLDPTRFNDIHSLIYAGSELLYAARVPGGEGVLKVPCGVLTHAGTHSVTVCYTNNTLIATNTFSVSWPTIAISVPQRVETFTEDVAVAVSFTNNICAPLSVLGNNNNKRVLQGGKRGLTDVWLKLQRCETELCQDTHIVKIVKLEHFLSSHLISVNIPCTDWAVAGVYRVMVGVETNNARNITRADTLIARSDNFYVDWSSEYSLSLHSKAVESCQSGHSLVVETNYPACILDSDKIRLYRQPSRPSARAQYIGEQRVIKGDTAVVFPCSMFNLSSDSDGFCFHYVSTSNQGSVHTVQSRCLGGQQNGVLSVWESWGAWSDCTGDCGEGVRSRYRFCSGDSPLCQGPRTETATCPLPSCPTQPVSTSTLLTSLPPRPTPVYGASPCECGCTYILHYVDTDNTREINIVSGDCHLLPLTWTIKVPEAHQMLLTVHNISFSCPGMQLNLRDGVERTDTLLYTVHVDTNVSVSVRSSDHVARLELVADTRDLNTTLCFAVMHVSVVIQEFSQTRVSSLRVASDHDRDPSFLKSELALILKLSSPVLLVVSLMFLIVVCTMIMLCDYQYKKRKYSVWKDSLGISRPGSPSGLEYQQCPSLTDISTVSDYDYTPLISVRTGRVTPSRLSHSVPVTPAPTSRRRRRLLRRSETVEDYKVKLRQSRRKLSLQPRVSKSKIYQSVDTIDRDTEDLQESLDKISDIQQISSKMKKVSNRKRRRRKERPQAVESSESDLQRTESERTLRPTNSVSEFSSCQSLSQELEFDLYDCHIDNVMAAPGSMFAPAYWDCDRTPSLELEMDQLFPETDTVTSPVIMRHARDKNSLVTSVTSDLTASISSAVSDTTLLGTERDQAMDISCYHSGDEDNSPVKLEKKDIMNLTHIEDDIQFVDD